MKTATRRLGRNARITMEIACRVKAGEQVLILTEKNNKAPYGQPLEPCVRALARACVDLGAHPLIIDLDAYVHGSAFRRGHVHPALTAALAKADVVVNAVDYIHFSRLAGAGSNAQGAWQSDQYLTSERRWLSLQSTDMDKWRITAPRIAAIRGRTLWLLKLLKTARRGHIRSGLGTDFSFGVGAGAHATPILGIIPLYGEVAVAPKPGSEEGILVIDGPTQRGVRPRTELDREPLRIVIEKGRVRKISGDRTQVRCLRQFMASGRPAADRVDEVGLVTTQVPENDRCWWEDGTHHHNTVHVALGNNLEKTRRVHGVCHMDGEIIRPTISIDGLVITRRGVFVDTDVTI